MARYPESRFEAQSPACRSWHYSICWGADARAHARALATRKGPILPLIGGLPDRGHVVLERHVCIDTTASGGNAQLLAQVAEG